MIDIAPRRVVGYAPADHLRTELVSAALANALAARDGREAALGASTAGGGAAVPPDQRLRTIALVRDMIGRAAAGNDIDYAVEFGAQ